MDIRRLKRDASKVHSALVDTGDDSIITTRGCKILIPERYVEKELAVISAEIRILGIFAIVVDDAYYAVSNALAMMHVVPTVIATIKIDGTDYLEMTFDPGAVVIADTQLVRDDSIAFKVFDEFISRGKMPWFIDYRRDLGNLFESAGYHAGVDFGKNRVILEMIAASIARTEKDLTQYYRHVIRSHADLDRIAAVTIPLRSISHGASNTVSKLVGSYFGDGLTAALANPSTRIEKMESTLRM